MFDQHMLLDDAATAFCAVLFGLLIIYVQASCCISFLLLLLGSRKQRATAAAGRPPGSPCSLATLLSQPGWLAQGSAHVATDSLQGLAAGFSLLSGLKLLLPVEGQWGSQGCCC